MINYKLNEIQESVVDDFESYTSGNFKIVDGCYIFEHVIIDFTTNVLVFCEAGCDSLSDPTGFISFDYQNASKRYFVSNENVEDEKVQEIYNKLNNGDEVRRFLDDNK